MKKIIKQTKSLLGAKRWYFVGIKGVAMTALALYGRGAGKSVCGSDVAEIFPTQEQLDGAGITVYNGFSPDHITQASPDAVIYTGAHGGRDNGEVQKALALSLPVFAHGQALGLVMAGKRQVAVGGSHGKTTTGAMIATILTACGRDPSYAVGCGAITNLGPAGHFGRGDIFVAEADEYVTDPGHDSKARFLWQKPEIFVVTNIDFDHPDVYATLAHVQQAFVALQAQQAGIALTVVNADDRASLVLRGGKNVVTYGLSPQAQYRITHVGSGAERTFFTLAQEGMEVGEFSLRVPGHHNVANAVAAGVACQNLGISWEDIRKGLLAFRGTKRRFEEIGVAGGVRFYDDYAHHPKEIEATIRGARDWYPKRRIVCIFQPHTFSRTKALFLDFSRALQQADLAIITDIYASARERDSLEVHAKMLVEAGSGGRAYYAPGPGDVQKLLQTFLKNGDIVIFMGAGDIYTWEKDLVQAYKEKHV